MSNNLDLSEYDQIIAELGYRDALLQVINHAASILLQSEAHEFNENLLNCMGMVAKVVDADRMYIWKNHTIDGRLFCSQIYEWSENAEPQQDRESVMNISYDNDLLGWENILSQGSCINSMVKDLSEHEQAQLSPQGILSILIVPIYLRDDFWGFVGFDDCHRERIFNYNEEIILRFGSELIANAVLRNEETAKAREADERIKLMLDSMPFCCQLWDKDYNCIDCNLATLELFEFESKQEYIDNFFNLSPEHQPDGQRSYERFLANMKKVFDDGNHTFEWMHQLLDGSLIPTEVVLVRVKYGDGSVIASYMRDLRSIKKMQDSIEWLESEVDKIYYDALTGIYNRRFFDETMNRVVKTLSSSNGFIGLMMIDIDFFKRYNDIYGHSDGDDCLKTVAKVLSKSLLRPDDFVARYGGEEFVVVLSDTDEKGACKVANRILENIKDCNIPHEQNDAASHVTVSIGIMGSRVDIMHSWIDYVKKADEMLYKSKQDGRNRYTFGEF